MSVLTLLVFAGLVLALSFTFSLRRRPEPFDPGSFPIGPPPEPKTHEAEPTPKASTKAIHLGGGVYWEPEAHPNPHLLIMGGSGSGKTCTIRHLASRLNKRKMGSDQVKLLTGGQLTLI